MQQKQLYKRKLHHEVKKNSTSTDYAHAHRTYQSCKQRQKVAEAERKRTSIAVADLTEAKSQRSSSKASSKIHSPRNESISSRPGAVEVKCNTSDLHKREVDLFSPSTLHNVGKLNEAVRETPHSIVSVKDVYLNRNNVEEVPKSRTSTWSSDTEVTCICHEVSTDFDMCVRHEDSSAESRRSIVCDEVEVINDDTDLYKNRNEEIEAPRIATSDIDKELAVSEVDGSGSIVSVDEENNEDITHDYQKEEEITSDDGKVPKDDADIFACSSDEIEVPRMVENDRDEQLLENRSCSEVSVDEESDEEASIDFDGKELEVSGSRNDVKDDNIDSSQCNSEDEEESSSSSPSDEEKSSTVSDDYRDDTDKEEADLDETSRNSVDDEGSLGVNIQEIDGIKCLYTNAECITNKRKELEIVVELHKPKIIGVVESWCHK